MRGENIVAWRVRDAADGWIIYTQEREAKLDADHRGARIEPLYVVTENELNLLLGMARIFRARLQNQADVSGYDKVLSEDVKDLSDLLKPFDPRKAEPSEQINFVSARLHATYQDGFRGKTLLVLYLGRKNNLDYSVVDVQSGAPIPFEWENYDTIAIDSAFATMAQIRTRPKQKV